MRSTLMTSIGAIAASMMCVHDTFANKPAIPRDEAIEARVEETLSRMTLDQKVGQMFELNIDALGTMKDGKFTLDTNRVHDIISTYQIGSVLNAPGPAALSREDWKYIIDVIQDESMGHIGIPCVYGLDMNHGVTYTSDGTLFPQNINVGASFNPSLARAAAEVTAYETRASNCPWTYSPTVDMARDPRWPRVWENFGEDPLVNAVMGAAMVKGFQGDDPNHVGPNNIAASVKHYLGYSMSRTGKDRTPAYMPEWELREKCFAPFKAAVEAGALTVMVNSASVNGIPVHANKTLLTDWLKDGLNWDGMIVTDWADIDNLWQREHVAKDKKEAIAMAINAGIDMSMDPYDVNFCKLLKELVEEGAVPQSRIDDAVRRILRLKYRLGLFENPTTDYRNYPKFASKESAALALQAAGESEILLKNQNDILPLKKGVKILVTGPNANSMRCLNGGWSYSWQGNLADQYAGKYNTIYEAIRDKFGARNVKLVEGVTYNQTGTYDAENEPDFDAAVKAAKDVDVIVACIGENSYCETPGNLRDLALSANQRVLVEKLSATGKPIVLVLNEGRPRLIADIEPLAAAVIDILLPGNYGGDALAQILAGDINPSGRLPYTYPRYQAELMTYDYRVSEETEKMEGAYDYDAVVNVQWPFGYGKSYTTFAYGDLKVDKPEFGSDDVINISVDVTNTGKVKGKESVLLFSRDMVASIVPENRRLRAFDKIELKPGETRTVTFALPARDLAFVGTDGKWRLESGDFRLQVGDKVATVTATETRVW